MPTKRPYPRTKQGTIRSFYMRTSMISAIIALARVLNRSMSAIIHDLLAYALDNGGPQALNPPPIPTQATKEQGAGDRP